MFKLVTISERVAIPAVHFGASREAAYLHAVNMRYANRVLRGVGLVVGVWRVVSVGAETLQMGCGRAVADVVFRLVVFAPFVGEAVWATIGGASKEVLLLAIPFFGAARVEPTALPPVTEWDSEEKVWVWKPDTVEEARPVFLDVSTDVVARVCAVDYTAPADKPPSAAVPPPPPMRITAALTDNVEDSQGLGDPSWWYEDEEEDDGAAPLEEEPLLEDEDEGGEEEQEGDGGGEKADVDMY